MIVGSPSTGTVQLQIGNPRGCSATLAILELVDKEYRRVEQPLKVTEPDHVADTGPDDDLPPGDHALEVAARNGFGPLSPAAARVWHGDAIPCVTCGQLVHRDENGCNHCGQDLSEEMIEKMRAHSGPWYVLEHLRPFPGVSLGRIVRQIRRGLITETSIVRGPSTDFQWRFAVETPGLCRYFGRCWHCHYEIGPADSYCQGCLSHLSFEKPRPLSELRAELAVTKSRAKADVASHSETLSVGRTPSQTGVRDRNASSLLDPGSELAKLANIVHQLEAIPASDSDSSFRTNAVAVGLIAVAFVITAIGVVWVASLRAPSPRSSAPEPTGMVSPSTP